MELTNFVEGVQHKIWVNFMTTSSWSNNAQPKIDLSSVFFLLCESGSPHKARCSRQVLTDQNSPKEFLRSVIVCVKSLQAALAALERNAEEEEEEEVWDWDYGIIQHPRSD